MASNPKDPMSKFFEVDIAGGKRSNFNWSYKNRLSANFGFLYPVGLWDVPSDVHFELDLLGTLSSNPTLAPLLGKVKFRVEAYFVEKAAYVNWLRNNDRLPVDRDVPFPYLDFRSHFGTASFIPPSSIYELLQIAPVGFHGRMINGSDPEDSVPDLNGIPFLMYYDIYRNYYLNPQDDAVPVRITNFVPGIRSEDDSGWDVEPFPIQEEYFTRENFDEFISEARTSLDVLTAFSDTIITPFPDRDPTAGQPSYGPVIDSDLSKYRYWGLLRRTLNNDFFTSFISNDNVDIMRSRANVAVNNGVVNVEQISLANRNWRIATRSQLWGTDWKDYNKVHYGVNLLIPYGKPQFLGALSSDVTFDDVISQAQTGSQSDDVGSNVNLGSRAALAFGAVGNDKDRRFVEFNTKDEGYVMVLASIVPEVDYFQGIDPMYFKNNLKHSWMVEYNSVGMQDFMRAWATVIVPDNINPGFENWNVAEHKVPIWFEYMAKYNQLHGDFTLENYLRYWVFARPFNNLSDLFPGVFINVDERDDYVFMSTYVIPEMFNYIFANNLGADNFQLQFSFNCKVSSMLDKQVISYL